MWGWVSQDTLIAIATLHTTALVALAVAHIRLAIKVAKIEGRMEPVREDHQAEG